MLFLKITLAALGMLVVVQTALSFFRSRAWWVRVFDFPRPQIALSSLVLLAVFGWMAAGLTRPALWEWIIFGLVGVAVVAQTSQILPYTRLWPVQVKPAPPDARADSRIRIVISNVRMRNRDVARWLEVVRAAEPDVIIAVEVDTWWCEQLRVLHADFPHQIVQPQDNTYGMAVYSRFRLGDARVKRLVEPEVPSIFTALCLPGGERVRCVVVHPRPPRPDIQQDSSLRDAELVRAGQIIREFRAPALVAGDLNDVAWSHTTHLFQRIARMLDPRIGRGLYATFPVGHRFLRFPLDHVFHTNHFDLVELRRLDDVGSDHYPMLIELALCRSPERRPEAPKADEEDEAQAIDAIEDAREQRREESPQERRDRQAADR